MAKLIDTKGKKIIALNKRASHEFYLEDRFEAGLELQGWEVKSLREGRAQITESYVIFKGGEAFIIGMHIAALPNVPTHIHPSPDRTRKLLLHKKELTRLIGCKERKGFTIIATALYWKRNRAKLEIALGKGKKLHDKRATKKDQDWERQKQRLMRDKG